jgi:hypothetical protein
VVKNSSFYKGKIVINPMKKSGKNGQVTIFIILAILIVSVVIIFFLYIAPKYQQSSGAKPVLDSCIESAMNEKIIQLSMTAGKINPEFTYLYLGENITYVCYSAEYHKPCIVQDPLLKQTFEMNLAKLMKPAIESCYESSLENLKARGYDVVLGDIKTSLEINPGKVNINIEAPTTISRETTRSLKDIDVEISSPIYEILMIATSIIQFETYYGDSETSQFNYYYPEFVVTKMKRGDETKIYTISKDEIKFQFATRSYAWPAGYGF